MASLSPAACSRLGLVPSALPPAGREPLEGFGAQTTGRQRRPRHHDQRADRGRRARRLRRRRHRPATRSSASRSPSPIAIVKKLPILSKPNLTIEGGGATLDGSAMKEGSAIVDIRTNDVIVRDLRLRNGDDNLRVDGPEAYRVVITHVSSTGAQRRRHLDRLRRPRRDGAVQPGRRQHALGLLQVRRHQQHLAAPQTGSRRARSGARSSPAIDRRRHAERDRRGLGRVGQPLRGRRHRERRRLALRALAVRGERSAASRTRRSASRSAGPVYLADNAVRGVALPLTAGTAAAPIAAPPVTTLADRRDGEGGARARRLPPARRRRYRLHEAAGGWRVSETEPLRLSVAPPVR